MSEIGLTHVQDRADACELTLQVAAVSEPPDEQEVVAISLRFLDLAAGSMRQKSLTASITRPADVPQGTQQVDADIQEALHRVNTANAIKAAVRAADARNLPE